MIKTNDVELKIIACQGKTGCGMSEQMTPDFYNEIIEGYKENHNKTCIHNKEFHKNKCINCKHFKVIKEFAKENIMPLQSAFTNLILDKAKKNKLDDILSPLEITVDKLHNFINIKGEVASDYRREFLTKHNHAIKILLDTYSNELSQQVLPENVVHIPVCRLNNTEKRRLNINDVLTKEQEMGGCPKFESKPRMRLDNGQLHEDYSNKTVVLKSKLFKEAEKKAMELSNITLEKQGLLWDKLNKINSDKTKKLIEGVNDA